MCELFSFRAFAAAGSFRENDKKAFAQPAGLNPNDATDSRLVAEPGAYLLKRRAGGGLYRRGRMAEGMEVRARGQTRLARAPA